MDSPSGYHSVAQLRKTQDINNTLHANEIWNWHKKSCLGWQTDTSFDQERLNIKVTEKTAAYRKKNILHPAEAQVS